MLLPTPHVALTPVQQAGTPCQHTSRGHRYPQLPPAGGGSSDRRPSAGQRGELLTAQPLSLQPLPAVLSDHPSPFCPPNHRLPHSCVHPLHSTQHSPVELPPSRCPPLRSHRVPPEPSPLTWRQRSPAGALSRTHLPSSAISPSRSAAWRQPRQSQLALTAPTSYRGELALGSGGNEPARGSPGRARRCEETELGGGGDTEPGHPQPRCAREARAPPPVAPLRAGSERIIGNTASREEPGHSRGAGGTVGSWIIPYWDGMGTLLALYHCAVCRPRAQGGISAMNTEHGAA